MPCALMFRDEIVSTRGESFGVFVGSGPRIVVLRLNRHLFINNFGLLPQGVAREDIDYAAIKPLQ